MNDPTLYDQSTVLQFALIVFPIACLVIGFGLVARRWVYWFHTVWIATDSTMPLERAWLIRVGDQCAIRVLQRFKVLATKRPPLQAHEFTRGYPLLYKRWAEREARGQNLPFPDLIAGKQMAPAPNAIGANVDIGKSGVYTGDWQ